MALPPLVVAIVLVVLAINGEIWSEVTNQVFR